jgi:CHRD domain-containing protein/PEP-CTERM motif-containing protein
MTTYRFVLFALTALFASTLGSWAQTDFTANLTPGQEVTAPTFTMSGGGARPASFGTAMFTLNASMTQLTMTVTITNIDVNGTQTPTDTNDNLAAAHIHGGAGPGANASVVWGFFGSPDNDNNPDQLVITPFSKGVGGTFTSIWDAPEGNSTTLNAQLNNLFNGLCYINFHTSQNPGGEIRGQIVPEPSTTILFAAGIASTAAVLWKRRRARM